MHKNYLSLSAASLLGLSLFNSLGCTIQTTSTLEPIIAACQKADKDTLVIFDVDEVLTRLTDSVLQNTETRNEFFIPLHDPNYTGISPWISIIWPSCTLQLVDPTILELLDFLKSHQIKTMALTAGWAGTVGIIENFEKIRAERLKQLGIEFDWSFDTTQKILFPNLTNYDHHPLFYNGILFACQIPKSKVLKEFLQHMQHTPKHIILLRIP